MTVDDSDDIPGQGQITFTSINATIGSTDPSSHTLVVTYDAGNQDYDISH